MPSSLRFDFPLSSGDLLSDLTSVLCVLLLMASRICVPWLLWLLQLLYASADSTEEARHNEDQRSSNSKAHFQIDYYINMKCIG